MGSLADAANGDAERVQDVLVPWVLSNSTGKKKDEGGPEPEPQVFERYYHLFVEGELQNLVENAARDDGFTVLNKPAAETSSSGKWLRTVATGWEADNWWIEGEVGTFA